MTKAEWHQQLDKYWYDVIEQNDPDAPMTIDDLETYLSHIDYLQMEHLPLNDGTKPAVNP